MRLFQTSKLDGTQTSKVKKATKWLFQSIVDYNECKFSNPYGKTPVGVNVYLQMKWTKVSSKPSLGSYHGILFISTMPEALSIIVINKWKLKLQRLNNRTVFS